MVYSQMATGHSTLYFYILLASMKIFGINSFALRLPSAVFGVANILMIFLMMRQVFKYNLIAFMTALVFLTMRWYFNFARFSFEATFLLFLELTSIYFLLKFLHEKKKNGLFPLIISAVFAGLTFHSYYPGRIFFILPAIWIAMNSQKKYFFIFIALFGIIASPLIWNNVVHPDVRISQISFLSDPKIAFDDKITGVVSNILKTLMMPFWKGDMNGRHNFPGKAGLNPILSILLFTGMMFSFILRIKPKENEIWSFKNITLFFVFYLIISVIPAVLSSPNDNPNMLRTITMVPSIIYFIGVTFLQLYEYCHNKKRLYLFYPIVLLMIIFSVGYELRTYFLFQSRVFNNAFEVTCALKDVVDKKIVPRSCRVHENMF